MEARIGISMQKKKISRLKQFFGWIRNFRNFHLDVPILRVSSDFQKVAKKYQLILDHFQSQQQINQILHLQYQMHRFAVQLVF